MCHSAVLGAESYKKLWFCTFCDKSCVFDSFYNFRPFWEIFVTFTTNRTKNCVFDTFDSFDNFCKQSYKNGAFAHFATKAVVLTWFYIFPTFSVFFVIFAKK